MSLEVTGMMARSQACEAQGRREILGKGTGKDKGPEVGRGLV